MQPIPFVNLPNDNESLAFWLLGVGMIFFIACTIAFCVASSKKREKTPPSFWIPFALSMVFLVVGALAYFSGAHGYGEVIENRNAEIQAELTEHYDLELTEEQVKVLDYPVSAPQEDFEVYGSVPLRTQREGADFSERSVYLVWAEGELKLSESIDGKNFKELEATR